MAHLFICPNCGNRTTSSERTAGFRREARGCNKCGFGFLFELLDDYYPAPDAAFFVCDQQGRLLENGADQVATALEWGVRVLGKSAEVHAEGDLPARARADLFPAYDDDGGLL